MAKTDIWAWITNSVASRMREGIVPLLLALLRLHLKAACWVLGPSLHKRHCGAGACPKNKTKAGKGSGAREEWLQELGFFSLGKRRLRGHPTAFYKYLKGDCSQVLVSLFSQVTRDQTGGNNLKQHRGRFRFDIRETSVTKGIAKHWSRLPKKVLESPSLEVFKRCYRCGTSECSLVVQLAVLKLGLIILEVFSNLNVSVKLSSEVVPSPQLAPHSREAAVGYAWRTRWKLLSPQELSRVN